MSLANKGAPAIDKKLSPTGKPKTLNPDAAEFIPFALRSPSGTTNTANTPSNYNNFGPSTAGKAVILDISESSDDEAYQFWRHQLPDDITPDFNIVGEEGSQGVNNISFSNLSISGVNGSSKRFHLSEYGENTSNFQEMEAKPWDNQLNHGQVHLDEMLNEQIEGTEVNPLGFLLSQFPGFAADSLAEVYDANGRDLNLTIETLTQLELQVDNGLNQNPNSKILSAPNLSSLDFPTENQNNINPYRSLEKDLLLFKSSSTPPPLGVRKMVSHDSSMWKYDTNISQSPAIGSSRSNHVLASGYNGSHGRGGLVSRGSSRSAPVWFETGAAVENMYSEMWGEARDHARLRNTYFEQAREAYLAGYKALAKELSVKAQLHNMQMKAVHGKPQESIYHQRSADQWIGPELLGNGRGQERIIDLQGLHVSEAIHVLKRELMMFHNIARSADECVQVHICVGTGHHTRGTRTMARLPVAVQRYLLEEGLDYSEPQPGLLRVVL